MSAIDNVITQIEAFIVANGNEEITADVLRPLLVGLADAVQQTTGDPADLNTTATDLVSAINEVLGIANNAGGLNILSGSSDPNENAPVGQELGAFYAQYVNGVLIGFWQYNGVDWVEIKEYTPSIVPDIFHKKISLTASQFKNINTTPIDLIDAPGAGKIIGNVSGLFKLNFGTIPFNFSNGLLLLKNEGAMVGKCYIAHENANATVSGVFDLLPPQIGGPGISAIPNTKLQLTQNSNASTGDSTVDIYLTYEIVTL